jgi:PAS domain S-box-containing protein
MKYSEAGYFIIDNEGLVKNVNAPCLRMLKYSALDEIIGKHFSVVFSNKAELKKAKGIFDLVINGGYLSKDKFSFHCKDGAFVHSIISVRPLEITGKVIGIEGIFIDVTKEKGVKEELKESEERYRTLVETSPDGIMFLDPKLYIIVANKQALKLYGYESNEEITGKRIFDFIPKHGKKLTKEIRENLLQKGIVRNVEHEMMHRNRKLFPIEMSATLLRNLKGEPEGTIIVIRDISERKNMEKQLLRSQEVSAFQKIASGVAHEVRTPLNAILSITEALFLDIGKNKKYLPYLGHIRNQVNRLSLLMNDLLELGKPIPPSSLTNQSLTDISITSLNLWNETKFSKTHPVNFIVSPGAEEALIATDKLRLQQIFINLMENAAQNSPDGSEIIFQILKPAEKIIKICIIDRGHGIQPENLPLIFEPFFTTRQGGIGLGLSLIENFIGSMGGKITISNNDPLPGCTAEIILCLAKDIEQ